MTDHHEHPVPDTEDPRTAPSRPLTDSELIARSNDPDRGRLIAKAMAEMPQLRADKTNTHHHYGYTSTALLYHEVRRVLAQNGLRVVRRGVKFTAGHDPNSGATRSGKTDIRLEVEYAIAAPKDGALADLEWEKKILYGPLRDVQSQQALYTYNQRYWLTDKFLCSTGDSEIDAQDHADSRVSPAAARAADENRHRGAADDNAAQENEKLDERIERGRRELNMSEAERDDMLARHRGDRNAVLREMISIFEENRRSEADAPPIENSDDEPPPDPDDPGDGGGSGRTGPNDGGSPVLSSHDADNVRMQARRAGVGEAEIKRVANAIFGSETLEGVSIDAIDAAAAEAGLKLPMNASTTSLVAALIEHHAAILANAQEETREPKPREDQAERDDGAYTRMIAQAEKTLEDLSPAAAARVKKTEFSGPKQRLESLDAEIAQIKGALEARARVKASNIRRHTPKGSAKPTPSSGKLSLDEQIRFAARQSNLSTQEFERLKKFSNGNKKDLLSLIESWSKNGPKAGSAKKPHSRVS